MYDKQLNQAVKEGWLTKNQREKITSRGYLTYLARTNKEKGHKPKTILLLQGMRDGVGDEGFERNHQKTENRGSDGSRGSGGGRGSDGSRGCGGSRALFGRYRPLQGTVLKPLKKTVACSARHSQPARRRCPLLTIRAVGIRRKLRIYSIYSIYSIHSSQTQRTRLGTV